MEQAFDTWQKSGRMLEQQPVECDVIGIGD
jgi:hypothetical protein